MMNYEYYYAIFTTEDDGKLTVTIPDFQSSTLGDDFDDAYEYGIDLLAALVGTGRYLPERTARETLLKLIDTNKAEVIPLYIDQKIVKQYASNESRRLNITLPQSVINDIADFLPASRFSDRSEFLASAALFFIEFEKRQDEGGVTMEDLKTLVVHHESKYTKSNSR